MKTNQPLFPLLLLLLALAGALLLQNSLPEGMGLVNDSAAYINGARGLAAGEGYIRAAGDGTPRPITHFPPLFSIVLVGISRLSGGNLFRAAEWANVTLLGINILLVGLLVRRATGSEMLGLLGAGLALSSAALLRVHSFALSEPLFLAVTLASMLCLLAFLRPGGKSPAGGNQGWLVAAGVLAGLSYLTRYVGVALFAAALATLLLYFQTWRARLSSAGIFLAASLPWVLAWSLRNAIQTGSATNRQLAYHAISPDNLQQGLSNFWAFLLPSRLRLPDVLPIPLLAVVFAALLAALAAGVIVAAARLLRGGAEAIQPRECFSWAVLLVGVHALAYLGTLFFSMSFVDASTLFEDRILAPFYVDALVLGAWLLRRLYQGRASWRRWVTPVLALALLLTFMDDGRKTLIELSYDGQGYASTAWSHSRTLAAAKKLSGRTIYTNRMPALNLLANRSAFALLSPVDPVTDLEREDYDRNLANIRKSVLNGKAVLVVFNARGLLASPGGAWFRELAQGMPVRGEYEDGTIYGK